MLRKAIGLLRRTMYPDDYSAALAAYWAAQDMDECRAAQRMLCWFGKDGGFGYAA